MAVLISVYKDSESVSVCDSRCYDSTIPECHCVCGGRNHGAEYAEARARTGEHGFSMVRTYVEREGLNWPDLDVTILGVDIPWQAFAVG